jgi:hypothetical protein
MRVAMRSTAARTAGPVAGQTPERVRGLGPRTFPAKRRPHLRAKAKLSAG